jgi:hypothetical protein
MARKVDKSKDDLEREFYLLQATVAKLIPGDFPGEALCVSCQDFFLNGGQCPHKFDALGRVTATDVVTGKVSSGWVVGCNQGPMSAEKMLRSA